VSLECDPTFHSLPASTGLPLQALLEKERDQELRQALVSLPDANRLALLMHVWGRYSYEEIAQFVEVPLTTVEGRIHRAKRQLRQDLQDEGAAFLGEPPHRKHVRRQTPLTKQRIPTMFEPPTQSIPSHLAQPYALIVFTKRFSALVDSEFSLVRTLEILMDVPPPYGDAVRAILPEIEKGQTLSRLMSGYPDLFPPHYIGLILAGEIGGVLEETLRCATTLLTKEWQWVLNTPDTDETLFLNSPSRKPLPSEWASFSPYQQSVTLILFCEIFSLLFGSGVPILRTMKMVSELLPEQQKSGMMATLEMVREGKPMIWGLEVMGIFPRFALELINKGEEKGSLDLMLKRTSEILQHELDCRFMTQQTAIPPEANLT
jgi:type II secretory pathway component PulF